MLRGDSVPSFKHDRVTPAQIIILGFLLLIFTGAVLLMLPFSTQEPGGASFGDALFTATSATDWCSTIRRFTGHPLGSWSFFC